MLQDREISKRAFFTHLRAVQVKPEDCLMVGDWPERDVLVEISEMKTCLAKYGQIQKAKADYQIESFSKLLTMVDRCNKE